MVVLVFILLLVSAWITEIIGIHALFGAFLAGVIMPPEVSVKKLLTDKIEDVSMLLLLPIFFAYTGLRTQIGLIGEQNLWLVFGLIMAVAVGGKFGGSAFTARLMGQSWTDSLSIGALMNTRGLMELIVLNIGYDLGILSPEIFALLVLMALLTTFMTGPLLTMFAHPSLKRKTKEVLRAEVVCSENS
jgi:Kef-type K+ transport system membrane component KefB